MTMTDMVIIYNPALEHTMMQQKVLKAHSSLLMVKGNSATGMHPYFPWLPTIIKAGRRGLQKAVCNASSLCKSWINLIEDYRFVCL